MNPGGITVLAPGPLSTVQDLGRPGYGHLGIGRSGAADGRSHHLANRLVGNDPAAATIETTLGRLRLRFDEAAVVALTGAPATIRVTGMDQPMNKAIEVAAGQELRFGAPTSGLRSYLAVRGGVNVPAVLGSRSTDTLSGLGPAPLAAGTVLSIGPAGSARPGGRVPGPWLPSDTGRPELAVLRGPRDDWFTSGALDVLGTADWTVTTEANRVGVRLAGLGLERSRPGELPSEPMIAGAVQIPPNGQPIVFLADHPVTGGYPVIAVVVQSDLPLAAQLRPGQRVRFRLIG